MIVEKLDSCYIKKWTFYGFLSVLWGFFFNRKVVVECLKGIALENHTKSEKLGKIWFSSFIASLNILLFRVSVWKTWLCLLLHNTAPVFSFMKKCHERNLLNNSINPLYVFRHFSYDFRRVHWEELYVNNLILLQRVLRKIAMKISLFSKVTR